jgi:hypothetical protein
MTLSVTTSNHLELTFQTISFCTFFRGLPANPVGESRLGYRPFEARVRVRVLRVFCPSLE